MITLKKSFELQNYISQLYHEALGVLSTNDNITTTVQNHLRKKSFSEAENEKVIVKKQRELPYTINQLIDFADVLLRETEKLTYAINNAKHSATYDYDGMIAVNNRKRTLLLRLEAMSSLKSSESVIRGQSEKFNATGEQVTYYYDIEQVTTIDYDRNMVKKKLALLREELDEVSSMIDMAQLTTQVDYDPIFTIGETLDDVVENYYK